MAKKTAPVLPTTIKIAIIDIHGSDCWDNQDPIITSITEWTEVPAADADIIQNWARKVNSTSEYGTYRYMVRQIVGKELAATIQDCLDAARAYDEAEAIKKAERQAVAARRQAAKKESEVARKKKQLDALKKELGES